MSLPPVAVEPAIRFSRLSHRAIGCAIEVHRTLGPGLLESAYKTCLLHELARAGLPVQAEVPFPILYKGELLECGFRADLIVGGELLLELKAVERLLPVHEAQILTYLKLARLHEGLLLNFNAVPLRNGLRRFVR